MKVILDTKYAEMELKFLTRHNCEILSEIKLSKTDFSENKTPRRMFKYGNVYVAEIYDDESTDLVWAVLSKWKGTYHFSSYYEGLEVLENNL